MNATDNAPAILNDGASCEPISMDCSVAQLLRTLKAQGFGKTHQSRGFRQPFIDNPYLEQITLRQLLSSPLAMGDFLQRCRALPNCGEAQMSLLLAAIELVATPNVDEDAGLR